MKSLVVEYLENISTEALEKKTEIIQKFVGKRPGIYALYNDDKLYYIGLASDLKRRLDQHLKNRHRSRWNKFSVYLTNNSTPLKELESLILRTGKPVGNQQKAKFSRQAKDLRSEFRKEIKSSQQQELAAIMGTSFPSACGIVKLKSTYKGKVYRASLHKDGCIRYAGKRYNSPSAAGYAVRKKATNGWWFWRYEKTPGNWVNLDERRIRRKIDQTRS